MFNLETGQKKLEFYTDKRFRMLNLKSDEECDCEDYGNYTLSEGKLTLEFEKDKIGEIDTRELLILSQSDNQMKLKDHRLAGSQNEFTMTTLSKN